MKTFNAKNEIPTKLMLGRNNYPRDIVSAHIPLQQKSLESVSSVSSTPSASRTFDGRYIVQAPTAGKFSVEIDGVIVAGLISIDGIQSESEVIEYKDGEDGTAHFRPGRVKYANIKLTKDWSNTGEWFKWRKAVLDGKVDRKSISVIFHNDAGVESGRYNFFECWPVSWTLPSLNAKNSGHATEKIDIQFEEMEFKSN